VEGHAFGADAGLQLVQALADVTDLRLPGAERDALWLALWQSVTTQREAWVTPVASTARVRVTSNDASVELITAWEWLSAHLDRARAMSPSALFMTLRRVATCSHRGSARSVMADAMGGITNVPTGIWLHLDHAEVDDRLAS
jgi:hypothetical protein